MSFTDQEIERYSIRLGNPGAARTDPYFQYHLTLLRNLLTIVEISLEDQGVDPEIARKVIRHVVFGGYPESADIVVRREHEAEMRRLIENFPLRTQVPWPHL